MVPSVRAIDRHLSLEVAPSQTFHPPLTRGRVPPAHDRAQLSRQALRAAAGLDRGPRAEGRALVGNALGLLGALRHTGSSGDRGGAAPPRRDVRFPRPALLLDRDPGLAPVLPGRRRGGAAGPLCAEPAPGLRGRSAPGEPGHRGRAHRDPGVDGRGPRRPAGPVPRPVRRPGATRHTLPTALRLAHPSDQIELGPVQLDLSRGFSVTTELVWDEPAADPAAVLVFASTERHDWLALVFEGDGRPALYLRRDGQTVAATVPSPGKPTRSCEPGCGRRCPGRCRPPAS